MEKPYIEGEKVIEADQRFKHVMAVTLNPTSGYEDGVLRCITSRSGDLAIKGNVDRSELHRITKDKSGKFKIGERLSLKNEEEITKKLNGDNLDLLGLEDPDIFIDETGLMHLYFTMPFHNKLDEERGRVYLGHAVGKNLDSLEMTMPVLTADKDGHGAKEVSIAPVNSKGFRFNLIESSAKGEEFLYSTVRKVVATDMGKPWEFVETLFNPEDHQDNSWIAGHASPGPLLPKSFIDVGEGKLVGIINGCEANQKVGKDIKYGNFTIGLFVYNYENGKIIWVSGNPLIQDSEAGKNGGRAITFASQFIDKGNGKGTLYAHIDDSFVREYELDAEEIKKLLPASY